MHVQLSTGLKHQHTQNSRQLWGWWVGLTLYAISIQKKLLTIMDGPLVKNEKVKLFEPSVFFTCFVLLFAMHFFYLDLN